MAEVSSPRPSSNENEPTIIYSDQESLITSDSISRSPLNNDSDIQSTILNSIPISRPLSRSSVTSGLSVTATKDGIEGKRIKKTGIPGYPLNLINKMYPTYNTNANRGINNYLNTNEYTTSINQELDNASIDNADDRESVLSLSSMIPQYSKDDISDPHESHHDTQSLQKSFNDLEKLNSDENDYGNFDVKSGQESLESSDYKTFLRRSSGV